MACIDIAMDSRFMRKCWTYNTLSMIAGRARSTARVVEQHVTKPPFRHDLVYRPTFPANTSRRRGYPAPQPALMRPARDPPRL